MHRKPGFYWVRIDCMETRDFETELDTIVIAEWTGAKWWPTRSLHTYDNKEAKVLSGPLTPPT